MAKPKTKPRKHERAPFSCATEDRWKDMVRRAMERQDQKMPQVAKAAGCSRESISRWFSGDRPIQAARLARIFDFLRIKVVGYLGD